MTSIIFKTLLGATFATALLLLSGRREQAAPAYLQHAVAVPEAMGRLTSPSSHESYMYMQGYRSAMAARSQAVAPPLGSIGMPGNFAYAPAPRFAMGDAGWAARTLRLAEYNFSDAAGWAAPQYRSTIHVINVKGDYLVVGRSSCGIRIVKAGAGGSELMNDCDIPFSDAEGWDQHRYYSTIQVTVVRGELYILGRGKCGMYIYRLVGKTVELMNKCEIPFSDDTEWGDQPYYSTIHTAIANDRLFVAGRGMCGVVIYKLDYKSVMKVSECGVALADREGWLYRRFYATFDTAVSADEVYVIARSFYGMLIYKTIAGNRMKMVSDAEIKFSDAYGWGSSQYFDTIISIEDSYGIFVLGRDSCGMRIFKLIGSDIFTVNECDIKFSDENGWGMKKYYSTIGATVVKNELYIYGRGACGMYVYKFAPGSGNATELSSCKIAFSDENGWDEEKYYSSIHGTAGREGLLISARSSHGLSMYEQVGANIYNVSHWM